MPQAGNNSGLSQTRSDGEEFRALLSIREYFREQVSFDTSVGLF